jgi:eukaryotic-like serine/threonine-protein kinase
MPAKSKKREGKKKLAAPSSQVLSASLEPSPPHRPMLVPSFTLKLGDMIGNDLTVIGHLNRGHISGLYQVWSTRYTCALTCKILAPRTSPRSREAQGFKREAMLLRRLNHPQIVRIFGRGNFEGRDYLIQEYLHGPSIFELLDHSPDRRLPVPDAIKVVIHVCSALDHLHAQGFIYRDIKPSNIILRGGVPVLVDFDAAYRLKPGQKPGRVIGTDPYMASEQCLNEELYLSTDVYEMGAIFYEMLTGRWPYEDDLRQLRRKKTPEERYPQIRGHAPPPPERFNPGIPEELSRAVLRCLEHDPARRFQSVRELIRKLVSFLEGKDQMWPESLDLRERVA